MPAAEDFEKGYSVLMPVYGREKPEYLKASISSMLSQTLPCSDFVLVCDGPLTKELEAVIDWAAGELEKRFQCVRFCENQGLGKALREGLRYCRCPVVARMDSDDISRPDRCRLQMECLQTGKYDIVGGSIREFVRKPGDSSRERILPEKPEQILAFAAKRNPFNHPCVMFRREAVLDAGNYQDFPGFEDYALWVRMLKNGSRGYNPPEVVLDMRTGNGMYERRGGMAYVRSVIAFQRYLLEEKFISRRCFCYNCIVRSLVGAAPGGLRETFYKIFLRRKARVRGKGKK